MRENQNTIKNILEIIKHWTKTEYYLDNAKVSLQCIESFMTILDCEKKCNECVINNEYCYVQAGWGCKFINSISLRRESYYSYNSNLAWYEFGHFVDDEWIIDKDRIFNRLKDEISEKHIDICVHFMTSRLETALKSLPEKILVSDCDECKWEYKYKDAPLGMTQTEIIGVKPRSKQTIYSKSSSNMSISTALEDKRKNPIEKEPTEKNIPTVTFKDIGGGIDDIIQQIREAIELPLICPPVFEHYHIKPHKGILLYGPPGCGKTLIAKAVANEINAHFISVKGPEILNKYVGQSEHNLRAIFKAAQQYSPTVIYFDEFDSISSTRDAERNPLMTSVVNQLLTLMDGMDDLSQICSIASTNRIDMIDEAIKRPGRFDYVIEVQRPTSKGCKSIFNIHTENKPIDKNFDKDKFVDKYLLGRSGAEIAFVASEAAYNSIRRTVDINQILEQKSTFNISKENIILEQDFIKAAKSLKESQKRADNYQFRYNL